MEGVTISEVTKILEQDNARHIIGKVADDKEWFKQIGKGEELGKFVFGKAFEGMQGTDFHSKLLDLRKWAIGK